MEVAGIFFQAAARVTYFVMLVKTTVAVWLGGWQRGLIAKKPSLPAGRNISFFLSLYFVSRNPFSQAEELLIPISGFQFTQLQGLLRISRLQAQLPRASLGAPP